MTGFCRLALQTLLSEAYRNIISQKLEKDVEYSDFSNLRFEQKRRFIPGRTFLLGAVLTAFNLAWWFIPQNALYWLLLVSLGILSWLASFGGRNALFAIHNLIHFLESH
jgi:hypothetical protein